MNTQATFTGLEPRIAQHRNLLKGIATLDSTWDKAILKAADELRLYLNMTGQGSTAETLFGSDDGALIAAAYTRLYGSDYIELPDAAIILFDLPNREAYRANAYRVHMTTLIKQGRLILYWDSAARYPRRLRKADVTALKKELDAHKEGRLSPQEKKAKVKTLYQLGKGLTTRQIAAQLGISQKTVSAYLNTD